MVTWSCASSSSSVSPSCCSSYDEKMKEEEEEANFGAIGMEMSLPVGNSSCRYSISVDSTRSCDSSAGGGAPSCFSSYPSSNSVVFIVNENGNESTTSSSPFGRCRSRNAPLVPVCSFDDVHVHADQILGEGAFAMVCKATWYSAKSNNQQNQHQQQQQEQQTAGEGEELQNDVACTNSSTNSTVTMNVALKCLKQVELDFGDCQEDMINLKEEARILSTLNHPNIVKIHATGNFEGHFFFLMDCLRGENTTLESCLLLWRTKLFNTRSQEPQKKKKKNSKMKFQKRSLFWKQHKKENPASSSLILSTEALGSPSIATIRTVAAAMISAGSEDDDVPCLYDRIANIGLKLSEALSYLHSRKIVHCDIKPSNIGFDNEGNVQLFDFGLSKDLSSSEQQQHHDDGGNDFLSGSYRYMAPEVMQAQSACVSSDVYSFSLLLWELATLEKPHKDIRDIPTLANCVVHGDGRPSLKVLSLCSKKLCEVLSECWAADPWKRPGSDEVSESLEEVLLELKQQQQQQQEQKEKPLLHEQHQDDGTANETHQTCETQKASNESKKTTITAYKDNDRVTSNSMKSKKKNKVGLVVVEKYVKSFVRRRRNRCSTKHEEERGQQEGRQNDVDYYTDHDADKNEKNDNINRSGNITTDDKPSSSSRGRMMWRSISMKMDSNFTDHTSTTLDLSRSLHQGSACL